MDQYVPDGKVLTEFFWDRSELSVIQGPIQSGTSTASCHRVWALACEQAPDNDGVRRTRWLLLRRSYRELKKTLLKTWMEWFPESRWGVMERAEPMSHMLRQALPDGTRVECEVIFLAIPDAEAAEEIAASFEITGFFFNEAQFVEKLVIDELLSRCGRYPSKRNGPGATWHGGWLDLNAPVEGHWIPYMRGDMPMPQEWSEEMKAEFEPPEDWKFYLQPPGLIEKRVDGKIVYFPNPEAENQRWTTKSYMQIIKGKTKAWIDRRVLNKVGLYVGGKPVYPTFLAEDHVAKRKLEVLDAPLIVGLDFGREPAAAICQCINGQWRVLAEVIGDNESAQIFAPRLKRVLAQKFPGLPCEFWGDPRGADRRDNDESTAYDIFAANGMRVLPATTDNNPTMRTSTMESVLQRRYGLQIDPDCIVLKLAMSGGYHYPPIKGTGMYRDRPEKRSRYSHIVEAFENAILGGGEGDAIVRPSSRNEARRPIPIIRSRARLRSAA